MLTTARSHHRFRNSVHRRVTGSWADWSPKFCRGLASAPKAPTAFSESSTINKSFTSYKQFPRRVFSGIQPTGDPHLGNYLGAIQNWVALQKEYRGNVILSIVDLHALTTHNARQALLANTRELTATLVACGIDPDVSILYNQSAVSGHAELTWILTCLTPLNMLKAMPQFKDKSKNQKEPQAGLFSYPILMAADILLYKATHVPVGDDQLQHLELARFLVERFNKLFDAEVFPMPQVLFSEARRVMSLKDATKKMSKSDPSEASRLCLRDSSDHLRDKIRKAKTDSISGVTYDKEKRPEVANLLQIWSAIAHRSPTEIALEYERRDMGAFKEGLVEVVESELGPIRHRLEALLKDPDHLDQILAKGAKRANQEAQQTLVEVRKVIGLL